MSQSQYVYFKAPLKSWDQNIHFLGIINPGRYCGFDTLQVTSANTLKVGHTGTGISVRDYNFTLLGPWGTWVTKQGVYIRETQALGDTATNGFTIQSNLGNDFWRYDILVGEHNFVPIANSQQDATYFVIPGPVNAAAGGGPALAQLPNPNRQVILAIIAIPPQTDDLTLSAVKIITMRVPDTGAEPDAKLNQANQFTATQQERFYPNVIYNAESAGFWNLPPVGNGFRIEPVNFSGPINSPAPMYALKIDDSPVYNGTKITLRVNGLVQLYDNYFPDTSTNYWYQRGYRRIRFNHKWANLISNAGGADRAIMRVPPTLSNQGIFQAANLFMVIDLELIQDQWVVKAVNYEHASATQDSAAAVVCDLRSDLATQPALIAGFTGPFGGTSWSLTPAWNKKIYGGLPFAYFPGGGTTMAFRETGLIEVSVQHTLRLDFAGLLSNAAATINAPTWLGPGNLSLLMYHYAYGATAPVNFQGQTEYLLDYRDRRTINPRHLGGYDSVGGSYGRYLVITIKGSQILKVKANDQIDIQLILDSPVDGTLWELSNSTKGANKWTTKWLGSGEQS